MIENEEREETQMIKNEECETPIRRFSLLKELEALEVKKIDFGLTKKEEKKYKYLRKLLER